MLDLPDSARTICSFFHSHGSSYSAGGRGSDSGRVRGMPSRTSSYGTSQICVDPDPSPSPPFNTTHTFRRSLDPRRRISMGTKTDLSHTYTEQSSMVIQSPVTCLLHQRNITALGIRGYNLLLNGFPFWVLFLPHILIKQTWMYSIK